MLIYSTASPRLLCTVTALVAGRAVTAVLVAVRVTARPGVRHPVRATGHLAAPVVVVAAVAVTVAAAAPAVVLAHARVTVQANVLAGAREVAVVAVAGVVEQAVLDRRSRLWQ